MNNLATCGPAVNDCLMIHIMLVMLGVVSHG